VEDAHLAKELLHRIGETTPDLIFAKDRQRRMLFANPAVLAMLGKSWDEIRGRSDIEWLDHPTEAQQILAADARIIETGVTESVEERVTGPNGQQVFLSTKSPLYAANGEVIGLFGISMNITALKRAEALNRLLMAELSHRVRNTLSVVQAIARQTLKSAGVDSAVWAAFEARLASMSDAHDILTRESWVGADITEIVSDALKPLGDMRDRFSVAGPSAWVDAQTALALAMTFHELGTNAVKYGALSSSLGRVDIRWDVDSGAGGEVLGVRWNEAGGPTVSPPDRRGFGTRLIELAFGHNAASSPCVEYRREGIEFRVSIALLGLGVAGVQAASALA
jgi:PAS domain S-box-containing protein